MGAEDTDTEQLSLIKQMVVEKIGTLKGLDGEMAELVPDEELEDEIHADEYLEGVYRILNKINKALGPIDVLSLASATRSEPLPPTTTAPVSAAAMEPTLATEHPTTAAIGDYPVTIPRVSHEETPPPVVAMTSASDRVKLPKISLPYFRGNLTRWTGFWDSFSSAVHSNDKYLKLTNSTI